MSQGSQHAKASSAGSRLGIALSSVALIAASLLAAVGSSAAAEPGPDLIARFGGAGTGPGQFSNAQGVATDPTTGEVYVADKANQRVLKFGPFGTLQLMFGRGVNQTTGGDICTAASGDVCKAGTSGALGGWFNGPQGVAADASGNVWVVDVSNRRVQKLDSAGNFLLAFGRDVLTGGVTSFEICTVAASCKAGTTGTGAGEFSGWPARGAFVGVDAGGTVSVGDRNRVQKFDSEGNYLSQLPIAGGGNTLALAVAPSGNLFVVSQNLSGVREFNAAGTVLRILDAAGSPQSLAIDPAGGLYVADFFDGADRILGYDEEGSLVAEFGEGAVGSTGSSGTGIGGLATNGDGTLYVSSASGSPAANTIAMFGPVPTSYGSPPAVLPSIQSQDVHNVGEASAQISTQINPHFLDTTYRVQHGLLDCSVGPCADTPAAPGKPLTPTSDLTQSGVVTLGGLQPGTTYHYRVVATNSAGTAYGLDRTFTTVAQGIGQVSLLPDGRAYERVSPEDRRGYPVYPIQTTQSSLAGGGVAFAAFGAFGDAQASVQPISYRATRAAAGWSVTGISPQMETGGVPLAPGGNVKHLSADLNWAVIEVNEPDLAPGAPSGVPNLYLRNNTTGSYQLITTAKPSPTPSEYMPIFAGASADMSYVYFQAEGNLIPGSGAPDEAVNLYRWHEGQISLVSTDPPATGGSVLGGGAGSTNEALGFGRTEHAVSSNGSRVVFTVNGGISSGDGSNFARGQLWLDDGGTPVHVSASRATSGSETPERTIFESATPDGSKVLFLSDGHLTDDASPGAASQWDLYMYDLAGGQLTDLSANSQDPSGQAAVGDVGAVSSDLSHVYFSACGQLIAGEGKTCAENNADPASRSLNLYLWNGGQLSFVANIAEGDPAAQGGLVGEPAAQGGLVGDGSLFFFGSSHQLTAYDNQGKTVLYVYDAQSGQVQCASCNPSGEAPVGDIAFADEAELPGGLNQGTGSRYQPRSVDAAGRAFFTTPDRLVPGDLNDARDVYEWEAGSLHLISSGKSPEDSVLGEVSPDGQDVFFYTSQGLVPEDMDGIYDLYDARVGGGLSNSTVTEVPCEGDGCRQGSRNVPASLALGSSSIKHAGNVQAKHRKHRKHRKRRHPHRLKHERKGEGTSHVR